MSKKIFFLICCAMFIVIYFSFFGDKGIVESVKLVRELKDIELNIEKLKEKNMGLEKEIQIVGNETGYVEKNAREVLGLVRDDEIIYEFND